MHSKTTAIVFEHLAEYTADAFRGNDARGPKKLLAMPNGTKCRASVEDVLSVERALQQLAADARRRVSELERAEVLVERAAVLPEEVSSTSTPPAPPGEGVVDAVAARPPTPSGSAPRRT
jgi:hypothetical protein